jgi:hypothetical protein
VEKQRKKRDRAPYRRKQAPCALIVIHTQLVHWQLLNRPGFCMLKLRQLHRYLGVFFTPAILFFAFSGALQTFGLHESEQRGAPPPVAWIAALASVHKDQHLPEVRAQLPAAAPGTVLAPPAAPAAPAAPPVVHEASKSPLPLKLFVLALAIGLCATSLVGVTIAFSNPRSRRQTALMLVLGTLVPALLLFA